jgi:pilus assembly protein CpaE
MVDLPRFFRSVTGRPTSAPGSTRSVGVAVEAIGGDDRLASLAALFPDVRFEALHGRWPGAVAADLGVLITLVDAAQPAEIDHALARLAADRGGGRIAVVLRNADVTTTRRLVRAGAADVLPAPVGEPALALCLERLLAAGAAGPATARKPGAIVAMLKAGGGVGATALCVQAGILLAQRGSDEVCLADLDLQFGSGGVYLDLPEAITIADCLGSGASLTDTPYASALATHRSRLRLLAAPREVVALESLSVDQADALARGLRRDFALTLVDLPAAWTAWTNQILQEADQIVLVTHLSVPHIQLVKRQLRILVSQRLDDKPLTLVCNAVTPEQTSAVPLKSAERALGRPFDLVSPEDRRVMEAALNQGIELAAVRPGAKVEKAVRQLADKLALGVDARVAS